MILTSYIFRLMLKIANIYFEISNHFAYQGRVVLLSFKDYHASFCEEISENITTMCHGACLLVDEKFLNLILQERKELNKEDFMMKLNDSAAFAADYMRGEFQDIEINLRNVKEPQNVVYQRDRVSGFS